MIANVGVLAAAGGTYIFVSRWPDILVGGTIASLFLGSALNMIAQAMREVRSPA